MATTTVQSSSSLVATSSSAFTISSTPTAAGAGASDNNANPNSGNLFSLSDSPPLVVAFLAIGLFVVAIIGVFGWRHFSRFRSPDDNQRQDGRIAPNRTRRRKSITLGKRPVLWDLCVDLTRAIPGDGDRGRSVEQRTQWEHIAPMTTIVTYLVPHAPLLTESSLPIKSELTVVVDPARSFHVRAPFGTPWGRRSASAPLRRLIWPDIPPTPPPPQLPLPRPMSPTLAASPLPLMILPLGGEVEGAVSRMSEEIGWSDALSVQVSVIIVMPSQRRAQARQLQLGSWSTSEKNTDPEGTILGEFCIGAMDVPWSECG